MPGIYQVNIAFLAYFILCETSKGNPN